MLFEDLIADPSSINNITPCPGGLSFLLIYASFDFIKSDPEESIRWAGARPVIAFASLGNSITKGAVLICDQHDGPKWIVPGMYSSEYMISTAKLPDATGVDEIAATYINVVQRKNMDTAEIQLLLLPDIAFELCKFEDSEVHRPWDMG